MVKRPEEDSGPSWGLPPNTWFSKIERRAKYEDRVTVALEVEVIDWILNSPNLRAGGCRARGGGSGRREGRGSGCNGGRRRCSGTTASRKTLRINCVNVRKTVNQRQGGDCSIQGLLYVQV